MVSSCLLLVFQRLFHGLFVTVILVALFDIETQDIVSDVFEVTILVLSRKCYDHRHMPLCPVLCSAGCAG